MKRECLTPEIDLAIRRAAWLFPGAKVEIDGVFRPVSISPELVKVFEKEYQERKK